MGAEDRRQAKRERADRLIARARQLFREIADRHGLTLEWDDKAPVEVAAHLRKQPGLDWTLWLNLQNVDEIGVQSEFFYVEWFPADVPEREAEFLRAVDGLIEGKVRLVCKFGRRGRLPYAVEFDLEAGDGLENLCGYYRGFHFGRAAGTMILINGKEPVLEGRAREIPLPT